MCVGNSLGLLAPNYRKNNTLKQPTYATYLVFAWGTPLLLRGTPFVVPSIEKWYPFAIPVV